MKQSIKDTVLEIKEIIFGEHKIDVEKYTKELTKRSNLTFDEVKNIYNHLSMMYINSKNPRFNSLKRRIWETCEDQLMVLYVELSSRDDRSKKNALLDLCEILDRSESSIPFRYYNMIGDNEKADMKQKLKTQTELKYIPDTTPSATNENKDDKNKDKNKDNKDDLLDLVVNIVDNVEKADMDINSLFKGILTLSQKAVQNTNKDKIETLEGKITFLESELDKEKGKNYSLQEDVAKVLKEFENLKNEFEYFDGLNGKQKLQQLHNFNKNMKYIIDKFGGVLAVGV